MAFIERLKHGWNAFMNRDPTIRYRDVGMSHSSRPDRPRFTMGNEQSIVTSVYNRIAMDASSVLIQHVQLDEDGRFVNPVDSGLNRCLSLEANIDQTGRAFIQDTVQSMLDEGCIAMVAVDVDTNAAKNVVNDVYSVRTGKILEWFPEHIRTRVYNEITGQREDILISKAITPIVENPFYAVMNEPNSTMKRLIRKLNLLDFIDEQSGSGKLDLIIQLPYVVKSDQRRNQAEKRRSDIEKQLTGSKYGIAYTDGTEKITQLNRPVENNLMKQIEYLTSMLYSQLGITQSIMDGTADEKTMLNYLNRTIEPIVATIVDEVKRKWLSEDKRKKRQSIVFFQNLFKLVPIGELAEIADKFTRNEIMTSNEIRQIIGMRPSKDPSADQLRNKNLNPTETTNVKETQTKENSEENQNGKTET